MSSVRRLLFVHGAGGYVEDRLIADGLGEILGCSVVMPQISDEDMSFEAWAEPVRRLVAEVTPTDAVVAHSFGASILVKVLAEHTRPLTRTVFLLAMPDWSPDGWDVEDYAFDGTAFDGNAFDGNAFDGNAFDGREPRTELSIHQCRDDDVVPFAHLTLHSAALPSASTHEYLSGGHQFEGVLDRVAADIVSATRVTHRQRKS